MGKNYVVLTSGRSMKMLETERERRSKTTEFKPAGEGGRTFEREGKKRPEHNEGFRKEEHQEE